MSDSLDVLDVIGKDFKLKKISNGLYTTVEHDSLRIWPNTNSWYWFKNNAGGDAVYWLKYYKHLSQAEIIDTYEIYETKQDPFKILLLDQYNIIEDIDISLLYGKKVYSDYIKNRGISYETFQKYDLEMINNYYALIPIKDRNGKRIGALHRKLDDKISGARYKKYVNNRNLHIFNYEKLKNKTKYDIILLMEGAWSVMRFDQVLGEKVTCVATLSNHIDDRIFETLNGLDNVFIILDNDEAGKSLIKKYPDKKFILPSIYPDELNDEQIVTVYERIKEKCQTN
jgi:hypothetical protein